MRLTTILALVMLVIPAAIWGQNNAPSTAGHFKGWLADSAWGAEKKSFAVHAGIRNMEATFSVSTTGYGWVYLQTTFPATFIPWEDVTGWCSQPGTGLMISSRPRGEQFSGFKPEDLDTVVNKYLKQYAPAAEKTNLERGCSAASLSAQY
jgi:hypothetical protein